MVDKPDEASQVDVQLFFFLDQQQQRAVTEATTDQRSRHTHIHTTSPRWHFQRRISSAFSFLTTTQFDDLLGPIAARDSAALSQSNVRWPAQSASYCTI